jgi:hypothetical protein
MHLGFTLGLTFFLTATAFAATDAYFKFDNFPTNHAGFTDDTGHGLRGLLGFPFTAPGSGRHHFMARESFSH